MYNAAVWFEIYVNDLERARQFYESLLDIQLEKLPDSDAEYLMFPYQEKVEGAGGALVKSDSASPSRSGTRVWLSCADCAIPLAKIAHLGGKVIHPKKDIGPNGFAALIEDSEGNIIGLHSSY